jgi:hypothetical protein
MAKTKTALPADEDELDAMIADLAVERGVPYGVHPDMVRPGPVPPDVMGLNRGCVHDGKPADGPTLYKLGQEWRRRLIRELERSPEWVAEWRAAVALNERIRALCAARNYAFAPWEVHPADCDDGPSPWPSGCAGSMSWPHAQKLRARLIAELAEADRKQQRRKAS